MLQPRAHIIGLLLHCTFAIGNIAIAQQNSITTIKGDKISALRLEHFIVSKMDSLKIPGISFAYIQKGKLVFYKNFGVKNASTNEQMNSNTIFEACSMSKPLFAWFVLKQVKKKILDLDKPLYLYYTDPLIDTAKGYYKLLTARMVLCHASGFPNWRENEDLTKKLFFANKPGSSYGYSGEGYQYLARVLAAILKLTDQGLNNLFQKELALPLGITSMSFTWHTEMRALKAWSHKKGKPTDNGSQGPADWFGSAGSLHTNARDYSKFIIALMNKKDWVNTQMFSIQSALPKLDDSTNRALGFPHKIIEGKEIFYHSGNNSDTRSYCHFYKNEKRGIVMFSNCDAFFTSGFAAILLDFLDEPFIDD